MGIRNSGDSLIIGDFVILLIHVAADYYYAVTLRELVAVFIALQESGVTIFDCIRANFFPIAWIYSSSMRHANQPCAIPKSSLKGSGREMLKIRRLKSID